MSPMRHDVFLSYHTSDKPVVEDLARRLVKRGVQPWLDTWNLIPGEPWQEAIESALDACTTCAVFIGPSGMGTWQHEEMRLAIDRRVNASRGAFRVIPVLLPGAVRGERSQLPGFLSTTTWVEFRHTLEDEDAFHRLISGIRGVPPGPDLSAPIYAGVSPYRGLQVFDVGDWPFFFGREALVEWLLNALGPSDGVKPENRFLGIIGRSGSGKSSLARAGLIAAITQGKIAGSEHWLIAICKPGVEPLESLAVELRRAIQATQDTSALRTLIAELRSETRTLHRTVREALGGAPPERRLVVLVDQFEEIFTLCHDEGLRQALIDNLHYAATVIGGQTIVVVAMRADFYGQCDPYSEFTALLSDHQVLVPPMESDELRRAIERPAQLAGAEFEPGLVETLLDDVRGQPAVLPLLQHALLEQWNRKSGRTLTHAAYREIGGVEGALEQRAEQIYATFNLVEQAICKRIFLRLTQPGEGTEDTKRRATVRELKPPIDEQTAFDVVLARLTDANIRLLVADATVVQPHDAGEPPVDAHNKAAQQERQHVEVAHEALIRSWGRLRSWVDADRAGLRIHRQLTEAAEAWENNSRDLSDLYRGARLQTTQEWAVAHADELNEQERAFLDASL
jgi:TIR domain